MESRDFTAGEYTFRLATRADLPLLRQWLETPAVREWWGDPDYEEGLLDEDLDDPRMTMWIVETDGHPFAYMQDYEVHAWPQHHFSHLPIGSRGIDMFIGNSNMLGIGHGTAIVRVLAEQLRTAGAPVVAIDPDPDNVRARRAYERAGFVGDTEVDTEWGPAVLMTFR